METIERDYTPEGVQFYYLYKQLAHPELDHYVDPFTLEERLMHVSQAERQLGSRIPWIADAMTNELKHALGDMPIHIIHSRADDVVPFGPAEDAARTLEASGHPVAFTPLEHVSHYSMGGYVGALSDAGDWMMKQWAGQ